MKYVFCQYISFKRNHGNWFDELLHGTAYKSACGCRTRLHKENSARFKDKKSKLIYASNSKGLFRLYPIILHEFSMFFKTPFSLHSKEHAQFNVRVSWLKVKANSAVLHPKKTTLFSFSDGSQTKVGVSFSFLLVLDKYQCPRTISISASMPPSLRSIQQNRGSILQDHPSSYSPTTTSHNCTCGTLGLQTSLFIAVLMTAPVTTE